MKKEMSSIKQVLFNSGLYSITSILQKAIGFILLPLYAIYLTPEDYGITGIVNSLTTVLTLLYTLSLNGAIQRFYYIYRNDETKLRDFFGSIVSFVLLNSIILSSLIVMNKDWLITPFVNGVEFYPYIFMGIMTVVFNPLYSIYQSLLQTKQLGQEYAKNSLLNFGIMVILNIVFIVILQLGAVGQLLSYLITAIIFGVYSLMSLYHQQIISLKMNFSYIKEALLYSLPLLPHQMSSSIATFISRLFLNNQISTGSAGLFNIASQFLLVIDTFQMGVNSAYVPWFYNEMDENNERIRIVNFADFMSKVYLITNLAMALFIKEVIQIFLPGNYLNAWQIVPLLLVGQQIKSIYLFFVNTLFYNLKATKYIFIASLSGSILNIVISATFTRRIGLLTPGFAVLFQWIFTAIIVIILSRIYQPVPFKIRKMIIYVLLLIFASGIGLWRDILNPSGDILISNILFKFIILTVVILIIFLQYYNKILLQFKGFKLKNKKE